MNKLILSFALLVSMGANAGYFSQQSESYLIGVNPMGYNNYQCVYKTNPGNRGWRNFSVNFQGGCPRFVLYNAQNGNVSVPN